MSSSTMKNSANSVSKVERLPCPVHRLDHRFAMLLEHLRQLVEVFHALGVIGLWRGEIGNTWRSKQDCIAPKMAIWVQANPFCGTGISEGSCSNLQPIKGYAKLL